MDAFDSELEQKPRRPTEEELNWLKENGSSGEGIILCLFPVTGLRYNEDEGSKRVVPDRSIELDSPGFPVGEKTNQPKGLPLKSLLVEADDRKAWPKKTWPRFLEPFGTLEGLPTPLCAALLAGVHLNDFLKIEFYRDVLQTRAVLTIDLMYKVNPYFPGRKVAVETTLKGKRMLTVAEDWQERLREARPFRFRSWDEVLDVIEEK